MRWLAFIAALAAAGPLAADTLLATRTLRAGTVIGPGDVALAAGDLPGALTRPEDAVGQEARVAIYAGRPVMAANVGPPAAVDRNDIVALHFRRGGLAITAEGRALGRGAPGETVRVMNLSSRTTVSGRIAADGSVHVSGAAPVFR